jgi:hypothetical protein
MLFTSKDRVVSTASRVDTTAGVKLGVQYRAISNPSWDTVKHAAGGKIETPLSNVLGLGWWRKRR